MMLFRRSAAQALVFALILVTATLEAGQTTQTTERRQPDVIFVPTPPEVVNEMLKMANVTKNDMVYDLGCGDGRIVIAAVRDFGARGVGIDIDPQRIKEAHESAEKQNVKIGDRLTFREEDLFQANISEATVVTLYLLPSLNVKLRPKLMKELKPGTRIVSHAFDMGDWQPEKTAEVDGRRIYFWTIPKTPMP